MGNSVLPPISDVRIDKCVKKLRLTNEEVTHFWSVFSPLDREGIGLIRREDFFAKIVEEPRTFFGDSIFDFIDCDAHDVLSFGEYVEAICIFCLFERNDVLRFLFYLFDKKKTGFVDRDDLKHFILAVHGGEVKSNAQLGLQRIEEKPRHDFKDLSQLHRDFPQLLYPVFRLQISMMRVSLGESWWDGKKLQLAEEMRIKRKNEQSQFTGGKSKKEKVNVDEEELKFEMRVKETMGAFNYYVTFWKRDIIRAKLKKMDAIEKELDGKLRKEEEDEEEEERILSNKGA